MVYQKLNKDKESRNKRLAVLIDPDKISKQELLRIIGIGEASDIAYFFVGGSLFTGTTFEEYIHILKENTSIPVILFPGNPLQISKKADAILFLSLISGRNPEMLIGNHVISASRIRAIQLESIPTGYMLIDGGMPTSVSYMSNSTPIPHDKTDIAVCTAIAGEMLGLKLIYMDAGSGAKQSISPKMISAVRANISIPLLIGGGIKSADSAVEICNAGADIIVVGNAIEKNPELISEISVKLKTLSNATCSNI